MIKRKLKKWILFHDESLIFIFLYVGLAVYLTIAVGLFWLALVMFLHFLLECIRNYYLDKDIWGVILRSTWELRLDFSLVFMAFVLELYLEFLFGFLGIGAAGRVGAQFGSRFATRIVAWESVIQSTILSLDELLLLFKAGSGKSFFGKKSKNKKIGLKKIYFSKYYKWDQKWSFGDWAIISFFTLNLLLMLLAPYIVGYPFSQLKVLFFEAFHPFPSK